MKVQKTTGLAPMTVKQSFGRYIEGQQVLFSPEDATRYSAFLSPDKVAGETVTVTQPEAELVSTRILPAAEPAIPRDWQTLHPLQQVKIAEQIVGRPVKGTEVATLINEELARRETPPAGA